MRTDRGTLARCSSHSRTEGTCAALGGIQLAEVGAVEGALAPHSQVQVGALERERPPAGVGYASNLGVRESEQNSLRPQASTHCCAQPSVSEFIQCGHTSQARSCNDYHMLLCIKLSWKRHYWKRFAKIGIMSEIVRGRTEKFHCQ